MREMWVIAKREFKERVHSKWFVVMTLLWPVLMAGMLVVSVISGRIITKTGRYRIFPIIGGVALFAGMLLLAMLDANTSKTTLALYMIVLGVGMGFLMQTTMLIAQNSVEQKDLGAG